MLFKSLVALATLACGAAAWEIMIYENNPGSGPDPFNCNAGGTTVSGSSSDCIDLAGINAESAQVLSDPEGCACAYMFSSTN